MTPVKLGRGLYAGLTDHDVERMFYNPGTPATLMLSADTASCEAHRFHRPRPITLERHHVIPRAWQHYFAPAGSADHRRRGQLVRIATEQAANQELWDRRTVVLCRTGHGNVHAWIVRLMQVGVSEDPLDAYKAARRVDRGAHGHEFDIAYLALCRWKEAGGSLEALRELGLWGGL